MSGTAGVLQVAYDMERTVRLCLDRSTRVLLLADYRGNFPRFEYSGLVTLGGKR